MNQRARKISWCQVAFTRRSLNTGKLNFLHKIVCAWNSSRKGQVVTEGRDGKCKVLLHCSQWVLKF